jgi:general secretion pathway protein K
MPLMYVLWSVALLTIVASTLLPSSQMLYQMANNSLGAARAEAVVSRAVLGLLDTRTDRRWRADGTDNNVNFDGIYSRVRVQDELGRIDLNQADGSLFIGLLQSVGLDLETAESLTDKILDWRDSGALKRLNGAKAPEYRVAGLAYLPRNGPFQSIDELQFVMAMTPQLYRRIQPAITVYSGRPFIDPQVAPREALLALPGMNSEKVSTLLAARAQQPSLSETVLPGDTIDPLNPLKGRAFTIYAEVAQRTGVLVEEATVRLTDDPMHPYWFLRASSKRAEGVLPNETE